MKRFLFPLWPAALVLGSSLMPALAGSLFDHLRAFADTRYPVGDPAVVATNIYGQSLDGPKDIVVADLDGDGHADFAASDKDGSVTVYYGRGDGGFNPPDILRTRTDAPADQNGITIPVYTTNTCTYIWTNWWDGLLHEESMLVCQPGLTNIETDYISISDGPAGLRDLVLADLSGDGLRDIAVASPGEGLIYLFVNQGSRRFAAPRPLQAWLGVRDLAAGDFDGDGLIDLAAAGTTNGLAQYRSLGNGDFDVVTNLSNLATAELDQAFPQPAFYLSVFRPPGAARDELVMGRAQRGDLQVLAADGQGRLTVLNVLTNVSVHALDVGLLLHPADAGVAPDLVSVNHSDDQLEIRAGREDAPRFETEPVRNYIVPGRVHGVAIADLDHDGWNDLIVVLQRFAKVQVLRNNQGTFEVMSEISVGVGPRELGTADFNEDGRADAAVLNRGSLDASVLLASPDAFGFSSLDLIYPADGEVVSLQVYDFNGDGRDDVVQLHRAAGEMSVRLAREDGTLSEAVYYSLGSKPSDTRTVDVNHDGFLDVLAVDLGGFVSVRLGLGDGSFGPEIRTSLQEYADGSWGHGQLFSLTTGDFNGDGNVDIAAGYLDCRVGLFQGNGDGTFFHTHTHLLGYETHGLATGDFDGDGDIDLVATPWDGSLIVVNNHGDLLTAPELDRTFVTNTVVNAGAWTIVITDYNHDGDPDLLVDGSLGYTLYLGGPGLTFERASGIISPNQVSPVVSLVTDDFDGDGWPDIVAACVGRNCVTVSLGKPGGGFQDPFEISVPSSQLLAKGDLDGDGLPDLVGTGEVLWTALSSRPPWPAVPPPAGIVRSLPGQPYINELLAANDSLPLAEDGGRESDFVEIFNAGGLPLPLLDWSLHLERTNSLGVWSTNRYLFPTNAIIDAGTHLVLVCSDNLRSPFHTGFKLPAEGGSLCLVRPDGSEADRVRYPTLEADHAYARFQDGVNGFVVTDTPTPGRPNADTGLMPPQVAIEDVDPASLQPDQPVRFFATAKDDVGIVNLSVLWRRLDVPDEVTKRAILYDDGMNGDGGFQDGVFSGLMGAILPEGAEIQFYLECTDLSGQVDTAPGSPRFVAPGQTPMIYTLAIGRSQPALEISEIVAGNESGLQDEQGSTPDWIEIRNASTEVVSLLGVGLSQRFFGNGERLVFTNDVMLAPGQPLVIFADGKPERGQLHAPFKLNRNGDRLRLTAVTSTGARLLLDQLEFGVQTPDTALARLGRGGPWAAGIPTPRAGNVVGPWRSLTQSNSFLLAFPTRAGHTYTVQYKDRLGASTWTTLPPVLSIGLEQTIEQPWQASRFFRVRED
jgi:FG-GAP-like repeat/Lamin Tail Domain